MLDSGDARGVYASSDALARAPSPLLGHFTDDRKPMIAVVLL